MLTSRKFMTNVIETQCKFDQDLDIMTAYPVKNTFIDLRQTCGVERRRKSLPPSFQPTTFATCNIPPRSDCGSPDIFRQDSEDSTDIRTECSDETPSSEHLSSHGYDLPLSCEPCCGIVYPSPEAQLWNPCAMVPVPVWTEQPFAGLQAAQSMPETPRYQKLSSKAASFQPSLPSPTVESVDVDKSGQVADMLNAAKALMLKHGQPIASVDVVQGATNWSIVVAPNKNSQLSMDVVLTSVKDALLAAAEQSNNVYVLGYASEETAFTTKPHGFDAQLGVMDSTQKACWYTLTHGPCARRACSKQHPALQVPLEIFVEKTQLAAPLQIVQRFKQEAANIMMMLTAMLTTTTSGAQAFTDDGQAWRIEIYVREEDLLLKEHFMTLAQSAFTEAAQQSNFVHIMGSGATPFVTKSMGFSASLGEMVDQGSACWDTYMQGTCWRGQSCRWKHPQCLMPVNVVLKPGHAP